MAKGGSIALRIIFWILVGLLGIAVIAVIVLNIYVRTTYASFFDRTEVAFPVPATGSGFVSQDLDYIEEADLWLFSGYMGDGSKSPVYKRLSDGTYQRFYVQLPDGSDYDGHGGGITSDAKYMFLTTEEGYLVCDLQQVVKAEEDAIVQAIGEVNLDFSPAFMNIENGTLYTGTFYYPSSYESPDEHFITQPDGSENPAIMYAYPSDARGAYGYADQAERAYSITRKVQGMCMNEGNIVLSTSYSIETSQLLEYDVSDNSKAGTFVADGREVPLIHLYEGNLVQTVDGPPMFEGIENVDGTIYLTEESASNKYIFGKLYGAGDVYKLTLN